MIGTTIPMGPLPGFARSGHFEIARAMARMGHRSDEAALGGAGHSRGARGLIQLCEDVGDVAMHGMLAPA
jgi:hypothetical protein